MYVIEEVTKRLPIASSPREVLQRMREIVASDAIAHSAYNLPVSCELPSICGGNKFCAVGSLFWAAGVPITKLGGDSAYMHEAAVGSRHRALDKTPHLRAAWDALERAATVWMADHVDELQRAEGRQFSADVHGRLETLFESYEIDGKLIGWEQLLEVVDAAIELLADEPVDANPFA